MDRFLLFFFRLMVMAFAFFVACLVAGGALAFMTRIMTPEDVRTLSETGDAAGLFVEALTVSAIVAYAGMLPAMFLALYGEVRRKRGWLFYCLGGGAIALLALTFVLLNPDQSDGPSFEFLMIAVVAGMLGGSAYWVVAGHRAGGWLPRQIRRARKERQAETE